MSQTRQILLWLSVLGALALTAIFLQPNEKRQQRLDKSIVAGAKIAPATDVNAIGNYNLLCLEWAKQLALAEMTEESEGATQEAELARLKQYHAWNWAQAAFSRLTEFEKTVAKRLPYQDAPANKERLAAIEKEYRESLQRNGITFPPRD